MLSLGAQHGARRTTLVLLQLIVFVTYLFGPTAAFAEDPLPDPSATETSAPEPSAEPAPTVAPELTAEPMQAPDPTAAPTTAPEPTAPPASAPSSATESTAPTAAPTIASDKDDYPPGGNVVLTGANWQPGEVVHIRVNDDQGQTWSRDVDVVADSHGLIRDQFNLPEWFVALYIVTASGPSGIAQATFTDGTVAARNATTTPASVAVSYRLERYDTADCSGTPDSENAFTRTGPTSTPSGNSSIASGGTESVRVAVTAVSGGYVFDKWHFVDGNTAGDGSFSTSSASFCFATENNTNRTYIAFVKLANGAPTDIALNDQLIAENAGADAVVGTLSTTDPDSGNTHTYTLVSGTGSADNAAFNINGNELRANASFNFEADDSYTVRIRTTDQGGLFYEEAFTITVTNVNETPTDIALNDQLIAENAGADAVVGTLSTTDPDSGNTHTYTLVSGTGSADNAAFNINGNELRANASFNFEADDSYTVRIRTTDQGGLFYEEAFTITVTNVNETPTDIALNDQLIAENAGADAVVGTLSTTDPDSGNTHTYTLVSGTGSADNAAFNINGNELRANASFNFEADDSYTVRIRTTDQGGLFYEEAFTITVTNVNETPTANSQSVSTIEDAIVTITLTGTDPDSDSLSFRITTLPSDGELYDGTSTLGHHIVAGDLPYTVTDVQGRVTYQPLANVNGSDSFEFVTFDGSLASSAATVTVNITPVNDAPTADAQTATALEDIETLITLTGSTGPANESGQTLTFVLDTLPANGTLSQTAGGPAIVSGDLPLTLTDATLYFTSNLNTNASGSFTFHVVDNGGTANGGVNFSSAATVTVNITPVNDAPTADAQTATALEDIETLITLTGSTGPANESGQTLTFVLDTLPANGTLSQTAGGPAIVSGDLPLTLTDATLYFTSNLNTNASGSFTFHVVDNGGTANGGVNFSSAATVTVNITPVNDAPSFTKGADQTVLEDAGAQTVLGWATAISAGPANESGQTIDFLVSNDNNALFSIQPAIADDGTLTYTPAANAYGTATVTVQIQDNGGTANGGDDTSDAQTFTITVTPVNDAPSFTKGGDQAVLEDAASQTVSGWATAISSGPANESGQAVNFLVTNDNNALFSTQPAISPSGTLTYTLAANANGDAIVTVRIHDNGGTAIGGVDTSAPQTFTIGVTPVNDAPTADAQTATALEDIETLITLTGSTGPANESGQTLTFVLDTLPANGTLSQTAGGPAIVSGDLPLTLTDATLYFTSNLNTNASGSFTFHVVDNGGTANGGVNFSSAATVTVNITPVNDAPTADAQTATALEDIETLITLTGSTGPANESGQTLTFVLDTLPANGTLSQTAGGPAIVSGDLPLTLTDATLYFTSNLNTNAPGSFTFHVVDNGGTANGGVNFSSAATVTVNITPVNDAPSFTKGADQTVLEDAGAQTVLGWATAISAGPANESGQTIDFLVSNDNNALFSIQPAIADDGTLTYTPAANAYGTATVTVQIQDNGGTANGGDDTSDAQTFTITVTPVNDAPTLNPIDPQIMLSDSTKTISLTGISEGPNESAQTILSVTASSDNPSVATASVFYTPDQPEGTLTITTGATACGVAEITVSVQDNGGTANGGVDTVTRKFTVTTFHGHFLSPLKEGTVNMVQKGQVVPVKIDFGCPGSMSGLTPAIQLVKGDFTTDLETDLTPIDPTLSVSAADSTGWMRPADGKYIYNMLVPKTGDMTAGTKLTIRVRPLATASNPTNGPLMQIVLQVRK